MKSIVKFSIILLTTSLFSTVQNARMETIDTTQVGVEIGDWFVHRVIQGNDSLMGFLDHGEAKAGDIITTTVTGFDGNNVRS